MSALLLAAEETDITALILQYVIYAAVIVAGIVILILLKRASRLPDHAEVKNRLGVILSLLDKEKEDCAENAYNRVKSVAKILSKLDKLIYCTSTMARKERDGDMDNLSVMLEYARGEIAAYKLMRRDETYRLTSARNKLAEADELLEKIIERDAALKKDGK